MSPAWTTLGRLKHRPDALSDPRMLAIPARLSPHRGSAPPTASLWSMPMAITLANLFFWMATIVALWDILAMALEVLIPVTAGLSDLNAIALLLLLFRRPVMTAHALLTHTLALRLVRPRLGSSTLVVTLALESMCPQTPILLTRLAKLGLLTMLTGVMILRTPAYAPAMLTPALPMHTASLVVPLRAYVTQHYAFGRKLHWKASMLLSVALMWKLDLWLVLTPRLVEHPLLVSATMVEWLASLVLECI